MTLSGTGFGSVSFLSLTWINFSFEVVVFFYKLRTPNSTNCRIFLEGVNEEGGCRWVFCHPWGFHLGAYIVKDITFQHPLHLPGSSSKEKSSLRCRTVLCRAKLLICTLLFAKLGITVSQVTTIVTGPMELVMEWSTVLPDEKVPLNKLQTRRETQSWWDRRSGHALGFHCAAYSASVRAWRWCRVQPGNCFLFWVSAKPL